MFSLWVTVIALALLNTIVKEFIDRQKISRRARLGWSSLVVVVAAVGAVLTVSRAVASGQALSAINAKISFRSFTDEQREVLKRALARQSAPPSAIQIYSVSGDRESGSFGIELEQAIAASGWPAHREDLPFFGAPVGLQVRFEGMVEESVEVPEAHEASCRSCFALARALADAGFAAKVIMRPRTNVGEPPSPTIELDVGYRPSIP